MSKSSSSSDSINTVVNEQVILTAINRMHNEFDVTNSLYLDYLQSISDSIRVVNIKKLISSNDLPALTKIKKENPYVLPISKMGHLIKLLSEGKQDYGVAYNFTISWRNDQLKQWNKKALQAIAESTEDHLSLLLTENPQDIYSIVLYLAMNQTHDLVQAMMVPKAHFNNINFVMKVSPSLLLAPVQIDVGDCSYANMPYFLRLIQIPGVVRNLMRSLVNQLEIRNYLFLDYNGWLKKNKGLSCSFSQRQEIKTINIWYFVFSVLDLPAQIAIAQFMLSLIHI